MATAITHFRNLKAIHFLRLLLQQPRLGSQNLNLRFFSDDIDALTAIHGLYETIQKGDLTIARQLARARIAELDIPPLRDLPACERLAVRFGLSGVELEVLVFSILLQSTDWMESFFNDTVQLAGIESISRAIAAVVGRPSRQVSRALQPKGRLHRTGLLRLNLQHYRNATDALDVPPGLGAALLDGDAAIDRLFESWARQAPPPDLDADDFPHVATDLQLLGESLSRALRQRQPGVNVLIYGSPGTGKSQLVRMLANQLQVPLYEITISDDGNAIDENERLRYFQVTQALQEQAGASLILFDEADLVLLEDRWAEIGGRQMTRTKAWINQLLETNPVPTIWIANSIRYVHHAVRRRFDYIFEMPTPPKTVRHRILQQHLGRFQLSDAWLEQQARHEALTPGVIERAARTAGRLRRRKPADMEAAVERVVNHMLTAQDQPKLRRHTGHSIGYRLDYLNADANLDDVVTGLAARREGRLCLYGPPGTGKTAFADHLGHALNLQVVRRTASELLSCLIGETEKNIAQAFATASNVDSILLIDEIDSLLANRSNAKHNWEVTQVNELLTQIEAFQGIFVAATNRIDHLDPAAMRRFDLKLHFGYLHTEQCWKLFQAAATKLGLCIDGKSTGKVPARLAALTTCTPGDFAALLRRYRVTGAPASVADLAADLATEQQFKPADPAASGGIGFLARVA